MRNYQKILADSLLQHGWSLDEVRKPEHWWEADLWVISSIRKQHGLKLFVTFIVDPGSGRSNDLASVSEIAITREPLSSYSAVGAIASLNPHIRSYPMDTERAMTQLDEFRNHTPNTA